MAGFGTPKVGAPRPYLEAEIKAGAIASVAAWTGTKSRVTQISDSATLAQVATTLAALIDDLRSRGVTK